ncbi:MAG: hypothetical protein DWQ05_17270 [Calditrichaeota bacterium]|nr:MAG: hypothetical protein DWQ05_17270 [Calditrichota bacterium]
MDELVKMKRFGRFCAIASLIFAVPTASLISPVAAQISNNSVENQTTISIQPPKNGNVYVVAHRGAHKGIPENSLPAYEKAIELGCDFVEVDIRTTKDIQLVSIHNDEIDAYVNAATGKVKDKSLQELRALDIGEKFAENWRGTRIPTFEEILMLCKNRIGIYLDVKDAEIPALLQLIQKYEMENQVLWYLPFSRHSQIKKLQRLCSACLIMPDPGPAENLSELIELLHPPLIATYCDVISKNFIKLAHTNKALVIADEDGPESWEKAIDLGVDGIQTDHPEKLIALVKSRKN